MRVNLSTLCPFESVATSHNYSLDIVTNGFVFTREYSCIMIIISLVSQSVASVTT